MPELFLGLNDRVEAGPDGAGGAGGDARGRVHLEGVTFHPCVRRVARGDARNLVFTPPDGNFELMSYRLSVATTKPRPPLIVEMALERHGATRATLTARLRSAYKRTSSATNVVVAIPVPHDVAAPVFKKTAGSVKYAPEQNEIRWSIRTLPGGEKHTLSAELHLPTVRSDAPTGRATRRTAKVTFEIPYYTASGFQVRYLKVVEKLGYHALPWVRYITRSGTYDVRMPVID